MNEFNLHLLFNKSKKKNVIITDKLNREKKF